MTRLWRATRVDEVDCEVSRELLFCKLDLGPIAGTRTSWNGGGGEEMTTMLRPGPGSWRGLTWLATVGPSPLDPWRFAMGWSEVAARRLELVLRSLAHEAHHSRRWPSVC